MHDVPTEAYFMKKVPFTLDGEYGVLQHLEQLVEKKGFCVVYVAEAAGLVS